MDLNTRRLRYFLEVADRGHFGRAADALFLSPTALSEQVRKLEQELDVRLLDRNPRGAQLTPIGAEVAEQARRVLAETDALGGVLARHRRDRTRTLRLGFVTMAAGERTPQILERFRRAHPDVRLDLVHLDYSRQVQALQAGEVDVTIARGPVSGADVRCLLLAREPRMVMLSETHPLAAQATVRCADLADVVRVDTDGVPEEWRRWWSLDPGPDGTSPPYGPVIHNFEEQLEMAVSGTAISIVPAVAADFYHRAGVAFVLIEDAEPSDILLCARPGNDSPLVRALFEVCAG